MPTSAHHRAFRPRALAALLLWILLTAVPVIAQNPCADGGSAVPIAAVDGAQGGIGGTGHDGIAGTGHADGSTTDGVGGTGHRDPPEGGIGGTALNSGPGEGGVGGTGIDARGIVGVVTGFASICVGGDEVFLDARTELSIDGRPASADELAVGQVVEIEAHQQGGVTRATRVGLEHIVIGPVTAIDRDSAALQVVGQPVLLSSDTRLQVGADVSLAAADRFALGDLVAVSGLRRDDGAIIASRITTTAGEQVQLIGLVETNAAGQLSVSGSSIVAAGTNVSAGSSVVARGRWNGSAIEANEILPRRNVWSAAVKRADIEGYITRVPQGDRIRVGDFDVQLSPESRAALAQVGDRQRLRFDVSVRPDGAMVGTLATPLRPLQPPAKHRPAAGRPAGSNGQPGPHEHGGPAGGPPPADRFDHRPPSAGRPPGPQPPPRPPGRSGAPPPRPPVRPPIRPPRVDVPHPPRMEMPRPPRR